MRWEPTAAPRAAKAKKRGMRQSRTSQLVERAGATNYPTVTIAVGAVSLLLWIAGFFTSNLPFTFLAAIPPFGAEVWRYVTASLVNPSLGAAVLGTVLSIAIFVYFGWGAERQFGRQRFFGLLAISGTGSAAIAMLAGGYAFGLTGLIWGIAGAYVIAVWSHPASRNRLLISLAIWFVINLFLGGNILAIIGGAAAGIGTTLLLRYFEDRTAKPRTPWLMLAGAVAALIVLAVLRSVAFG